MQETIDRNIYMTRFDSISEFYKYICDTPINEVFRWKGLKSVNGSEKFTKTENFEEATDLLKNGWSEMANKLTQKLKAVESNKQMIKKSVNQLSVSGYQAIVPLYLNGVPQNMVSKKMVPVKQKVITLVKSINYNCCTSTEQIEDESIKALQIIKKFEAQGMRVNLEIILGSEAGGRDIFARIKIKDASEKLNISKIAFPLVHPSMLRRLAFRYIETCPNITKEFGYGYGHPIESSKTKKIMKENEYLLPAFIQDINKINNINDLERA